MEFIKMFSSKVHFRKEFYEMSYSHEIFYCYFLRNKVKGNFKSFSTVSIFITIQKVIDQFWKYMAL